MNKPTAKTIANLICGLILGIANKNGLEIDAILTKNELLEMATLLENKKINNQGATQIIDYILKLKSEEIGKNENTNKENQEINEKINNELDDKICEETCEIGEKNIEQIAKELSVLQENDDKILTHAGKISAEMAKELALSEYAKFEEYRKSQELVRSEEELRETLNRVRANRESTKA